MKKAIFHLHTNHSFDSMVRPQNIVDLAVRKGVDFLVISDHDSLDGSLTAREYAQNLLLPLEVPIAAEYLTDIGDIVVVSIPHVFRRVHDHRELCRTVKELGGHVILPHPYDGHRLDKVDFTHVDCIEVFNSRSSQTNNLKAIELARQLQKNVVFASDAHFLKDVCNSIFLYAKETPFEGETFPLHLSYTPPHRKDVSQIIKGWKQRDLRLILGMLKRMGIRWFQ